MSFRFQKRVKIAPGIRLNLSKSGISTSIGRQGASVTIEKRGLYGNVGVPGSGMSYRTRLDTKITEALKKGQNVSVAPTGNIQLTYDPKSHIVTIVDNYRNPLPTSVERKVMKEYKEEIQQFYQEKEAKINHQTERHLNLQHQLFPLYSQADLREIILKQTNLDIERPNKLDYILEVENSKKESFNSTKSFIFKEIEPFHPDEFRNG